MENARINENRKAFRSIYKHLPHNYRLQNVTTWLGVSLADKDAPSHEIIPEHKVLTKEDTEKVLADFKVSRLQIPRIRAKDAALVGTGAKVGQLVGITRLDGSQYYRLVVE